jgi:hypothetical protein
MSKVPALDDFKLEGYLSVFYALSFDPKIMRIA